MTLRMNGEDIAALVLLAGDTVTVSGEAVPTLAYRVTRTGRSQWTLHDGDRAHLVSVCRVRRRGRVTFWVHAEGRTHVIEQTAASAPSRELEGGAVTAPMTGRVVDLLVANGDSVTAGQPLLVLSAMKMRIDVKAGRAGVVKGLSVTVGAQVEGGDVLAQVEPPAP